MLEPDRNNEVWVKCPNCGKGGKHFSFSAQGCMCFCCSYSPPLRSLFETLVGKEPINAAPVAVKERKIRNWERFPNELVKRFAQSNLNTKLWRLYKPITLENIAKYKLGSGFFPDGLGYKDDGDFLKCEHQRLIVPLISGGKVTGFRCR